MLCSPFPWLPSPCPTEDERDDSVSPQPKSTTIATSAAINMLKINSLLNPASTSEGGYGLRNERSVSPPPTPAYTVQKSSLASTPQPQTPATSSSSKRQKLLKDGGDYIPGTPKEPVNYRPFEHNEPGLCLSPEEQDELTRQHERFDVKAMDRECLIASFQKTIPYSSDKRTFSEKTNREALEVFQYTFTMPETGKNPYDVMWDYQTGLVRMTPFFKALNYTKTTPAKALTANPGLKDLSHSITGGAIKAQGYWVPYSCARALCLTFCHPIRWALTPIFGPSFIRECLRPEHPHFEKFLVSSEIIRCAQLEAEDQRSEAGTRHATPAVCHHEQAAVQQVDIPRSVPDPGVSPKQLRPRKERPTFKEGSLFDSDSDSSDRDYIYGDNDSDCGALSPKSLPASSYRSTWASVNRPQHGTHTTNTVNPLTDSLLAQPRYAPTSSWRGINNNAATITSAPRKMVTKMPTGSHDKHRTHKRRISDDQQDEQDEAAYINLTTHHHPPHCHQSDDLDTITPPAPLSTTSTTTTRRKRARKTDRPATTSPVNTDSIEGNVNGGVRVGKMKKSTKYHADDVRAAQWLLNLSVRDSQLAYGPSEMRGMKRSLSSI